MHLNSLLAFVAAALVSSALGSWENVGALPGQRNLSVVSQNEKPILPPAKSVAAQLDEPPIRARAQVSSRLAATAPSLLKVAQKASLGNDSHALEEPWYLPMCKPLGTYFTLSSVFFIVFGFFVGFLDCLILSCKKCHEKKEEKAEKVKRRASAFFSAPRGTASTDCGCPLKRTHASCSM